MVLYTVMSEAQIAAVTKEILQVLNGVWLRYLVKIFGSWAQIYLIHLAEVTTQIKEVLNGIL